MIRHGVSTQNDVNTTNDVDEIAGIRSTPDNIEKRESMVLLNPDDYDSWNYLKRMYLVTTYERDIEGQLEFTRRGIQANPKCCAAWFHRFLFFNGLKSRRINAHQTLCTFIEIC